MLRILGLSILFAVCGCSARTTLPALTTDAGRADTGVLDASPTDAPAMDAVVLDAGTDAEAPLDMSVDIGLLVDAGADTAIAVDAAVSCEDPPLGAGRPLPTICAPCRPTTGGTFTGGCTTDADCTAGINGRCVRTTRTAACNYDECFRDEDCAAGSICECDGSRGGGNTCVPSDCVTDDDCGEFLCSPSLGSCGHFSPPTMYRCHTNEDGCSTDADCAAVSDTAYCAFDTTLGSWQCSTLECVA